MNTRPTTAGFRSRAVRSVIAAGAVAAVAVLAGCSPSADGNGAEAPAAAAGDVTIGLTYTPNIQFVPDNIRSDFTNVAFSATMNTF